MSEYSNYGYQPKVGMYESSKIYKQITTRPYEDNNYDKSQEYGVKENDSQSTGQQGSGDINN